MREGEREEWMDRVIMKMMSNQRDRGRDEREWKMEIDR